MTDCQAVQPQGQESDRGRKAERQRVRQLHSSFLLMDASSISFADADCTLTQDWPRPSRRQRGIILNDDCFYISPHFLCVSLARGSLLFFCRPLFVFRLPPLPPRSPRQAPIHTHNTTNCSNCVSHMSPVIPQARWLYKQRLFSVLLLCPLLSAVAACCGVQWTGQEPGQVCALVMLFWRA